MRSIKSVVGGACLFLLAGTSYAQNALVNPGFEEICGPAAGWTAFGNVSSINFYTTSGVRAIKMFGPFCCPLGYSGIYQEAACVEGQSFDGSVNVISPTWDSLSWNADTGSGTRAFLTIGFYAANGDFLGQAESVRVETNTDPDGPGGLEPEPVSLTITGAVAPAGAVRVRITAAVEQGNFVGGAAWFDDASLSFNGGSNILANSSFEDQVAGCLGSPFVGWVNFGNGQGNFGENARNGNYAAKLFGAYNGDPAFSGWYQEVPATAGSSWKASGWARSSGGDSLQSGNTVVIGIEFFDDGGNNLSGLQAPSSAVPTPGDDVYRFYESGVAVAPEGTAKARVLILQRQLGFAGGSTWWDDVELTAVCPADFDGDGFVDFFDFDAFAQCFEGGSCPDGKTADFDGDGFVDFFDFDAFVAVFETGC